MGIGDLLKGMLHGSKGSGSKKGQKQKCPNCGETVNLSMERCPKCGVRIKSMFRRKCPKCGNLNELDSPSCTKCQYNFEAELQRAKKTYYVCPICRYKMETIFPRCPACGRRLM